MKHVLLLSLELGKDRNFWKRPPSFFGGALSLTNVQAGESNAAWHSLQQKGRRLGQEQVKWWANIRRTEEVLIGF